MFHVDVSCRCFMMFHHVSCRCFMMFHHVSCRRFISMFHVDVSCFSPAASNSQRNLKHHVFFSSLKNRLSNTQRTMLNTQIYAYRYTKNPDTEKLEKGSLSRSTCGRRMCVLRLLLFTAIPHLKVLCGVVRLQRPSFVI